MPGAIAVGYRQATANSCEVSYGKVAVNSSLVPHSACKHGRAAPHSLPPAMPLTSSPFAPVRSLDWGPPLLNALSVVLTSKGKPMSLLTPPSRFLPHARSWAWGPPLLALLPPTQAAPPAPPRSTPPPAGCRGCPPAPPCCASWPRATTAQRSYRYGCTAVDVAVRHFPYDAAHPVAGVTLVPKLAPTKHD